eukprot:5883810-Pyramimonas_sp.AAC.1
MLEILAVSLSGFRSAQSGPKIAQDRPQKGPGCVQDGPKRPPRGPPTAAPRGPGGGREGFP